MFVAEIKLLKRKNLGNYEHEEIQISVSLTEEDSADKGLAYAKEFVNKALGVKQEATKVIETTPAPAKEATPAPAKEAAPAPAKEVTPAPAKEAAPKKAATKKAPTKEAEVVPVLTKDQVNQKLIEVAKKFMSKEKAIALIKEVGNVEGLADLDVSLYNKLYSRCDEVLHAN